MRKALPYLLVLLLGILFLVVFLFGVRGGEGAAAEVRSGLASSNTAHDPTQSSIESTALANAPIGSSEREAAASAPLRDSSTESADAPKAPADATLVVHAVSKTTREPLARIRVHAFRMDPASEEDSEDVSATRGSLTERPITGDDGRVELSIPSGIDCEVWAYPKRGEGGTAHASVPALRLGERRELTLELPTGIDLRFLARVVASENQEPIAGARVRVMSKRETLSETATGADGLFDVSLPSWNGAHVRVEAEGFGMTLLAPAFGHETPDKALLVPLLRGATLDARVLDAAGAALQEAEVRLSTNGYALNRPREEPSGEWIEMPEEVWTAAVAQDGRTVLRDLPPDLELTVEIVSGNEVLRRDADPLVLQPGQVLEREWRIGTGCTLAGLVLDQFDRPVPVQEIWLAKSFSENARYYDRGEANDSVAKAVTDAAGRFQLKDVLPGRWSLGPAASTHWEPRAPEERTAPLAVPIEVSCSGTQEITLRVHRGIFIRGKVLDSRGEPSPSTNVHASMEGADWGPQVFSEKDGSFALGPLAPGRFRVAADSSGLEAPSDPVSCQAGAKDVVLRLRPGSKIRGRVVDRRTGEGCHAEMLVTPENPRPGIFGGGLGFGCRADGSFEMEGFEPGRYGVAARTDDGRFGVVPGVDLAAGSASEEVTVVVSEGGRLMLRYEGTRAVVRVSIQQSGVPISWGKNLGRGLAVAVDVPAGTVVIRLEAESRQGFISRSIELAPGEEKDFIFRDEN